MATPTRTGFATLDTSGSGAVVLSPSVPTGSWMIVVAVIGITTVTMTPPAGWTQLYFVTALGSRRVYVWARIREAGDTSYTFTKSGSAFANVDIMWGEGARPIAEWQLGAGKLRNTITENDTTNIAPSLTTTEDNVLVLAVSAEATTTDNPAPTITGGTPAAVRWFDNEDTGSVIEFTTVAYIDKATAGATGDVTFTYSTTQANNGWAAQIGITPVAPPAPAPVRLALGASTVLSAFVGSEPVRRFYLGAEMIAQFATGYTVSEMLASSEVLVAHRGLGGSYVEQSMVGYDAAIANGFKILEMSLHRTSDGVFVGSHDATGARVYGTGSTPISSLPWSTVQTWVSPTGPILRVEELLDKYGDYVLFLDDKTNANTAALLSIVQGYADPTEHFVWKGFRGWAPAADVWTAAGHSSWGIYYSADNDPTKVPNLFDRFTMLGLEYNGSSSDWSLMKATGKKVLAHVVNNDSDRLAGAANGADGYMITNLNALP